MDITVKLFGPLAAACGREVIVAIPAEAGLPTCDDVRRRLGDPTVKERQALRSTLPACRFAINGRYATEEQTIQPGDEVALIGLVSGG